MSLKDKRTKEMTEILNGIRLIKLFAWEDSFVNRVDAIREQEIKTLRNSIVYKAWGTFMWSAAPILG